ncbi:ABC transporter substrate-binding protein [Aeoliella sp.]|uniref:ABC transporter substrate-binding protein n=1 Tax=Aeoliella sp. TaxID=2795800 RepID=UPI003CCB8F56
MTTLTLRGLTWNHTRGLAPLLATAPTYSELHPNISIQWEARNFWSFGEEPLDRFASEYDFIVFDHPFTGASAKQGLLIALDDVLPASYLADQRENSVGHSFASYTYQDKQVALAIDAAVQLAAWRTDLMDAAGHRPPNTWQEVIDLAEATGRVVAPLAPMGAMGTFFSICAGAGKPAAASCERFVAEEVGAMALDTLAALYRVSGSECLTTGAAGILQRMATSDEVIYAPCQYGYNNFAREGHAAHRLSFGPVPTLDAANTGGANLGGAGIGVFAASKHRAEAVDYLRWIASEEIQRTLYTHAGGQPGHRAAWLDDTNNHITGGFFRDTLPDCDHAYCRPTYLGFPVFQSAAGQLLQSFLRGECATRDTLHTLEKLYLQSLDA